VVLPTPWVKATPPASDVDGEPSEPSPPSEPIEDSVVKAVDALPEQERDVFLLREVAGLGFAQIASVTELSEAVVRLRLFQAFERLRVTLQDFEEYRRALR
jgi:RNA polymerase sigma-70 factor (ECF subfamily)